MGLDLVTGFKGTAHITAADQGSFNAGVFGENCFVLALGKKLSAQVITNNMVRIFDGDVSLFGRHIRIAKNTYEDVAIANGLQGMNRNDLIVVRYTKDSTTGIENAELAVIQGVSTDGTASDPSYTTDDMLSGECLLYEMPLYRIPLTGLNVGTPVALFRTAKNMTSIPTVTTSTSVTSSGLALDARHANSNHPGSLAEKIATLNEALNGIQFRVSEGKLQFRYDSEVWT